MSFNRSLDGCLEGERRLGKHTIVDGSGMMRERNRGTTNELQWDLAQVLRR
jgi:hypothetical protein